jgi:hypothetical protein
MLLNQMTRLVLIHYVILTCSHMFPRCKSAELTRFDQLRCCEVLPFPSHIAEERPHVTSPSRPPAFAKPFPSDNKYKDFLSLTLLFYKASKRSEPATTYACAPTRFILGRAVPTAQGCQSPYGGAWLCREIPPGL